MYVANGTSKMTVSELTVILVPFVIYMRFEIHTNYINLLWAERRISVC
jgi:hypothetical protein